MNKKKPHSFKAITPAPKNDNFFFSFFNEKILKNDLKMLTTLNSSS